MLWVSVGTMSSRRIREDFAVGVLNNVTPAWGFYLVLTACVCFSARSVAERVAGSCQTALGGARGPGACKCHRGFQHTDTLAENSAINEF